MPILTILIVLVVVGLLLWLVQAYVPMPAGYKKAVIIIVTILVVIWVLQSTGLLSGFGSGPRVGR